MLTRSHKSLANVEHQYNDQAARTNTHTHTPDQFNHFHWSNTLFVCNALSLLPVTFSTESHKLSIIKWWGHIFLFRLWKHNTLMEFHERKFPFSKYLGVSFVCFRLCICLPTVVRFDVIFGISTECTEKNENGKHENEPIDTQSPSLYCFRTAFTFNAHIFDDKTNSSKCFHAQMDKGSDD